MAELDPPADAAFPAPRDARLDAAAARQAELLPLVERLVELANRRLAIHSSRTGPAERAIRLRDHLTGHVLPRARSLDAPLLVLLVGPTGSGKSSLFNTLAGRPASRVGVLRPTTREAVVLVGPNDRAAVLGDGMPLTAVEPGRLRVIEDADAPDGLALLDAPDVDSIEHANRELADRLAEAADLAIFVTTATRYADRVPWDVLHRVRDRGLPLVVVVNRMPPDPESRAIVVDDVRRLLAETGLDEVVMPSERTDADPVAQAGRLAGGSAATEAQGPEIVTIEEGAVAADGLSLDRDAIAPIRERIERLAADRDRRRALATRALAGSVAGLGPLIDGVGDDLEHEAIDAEADRRTARDAWTRELATLREDLARGTFLRAEALRQWHAFVGADEITRLFSTGIGRLRGTLSVLIRGAPRAPVAEVREETLADITALARSHAAEAARRTATAWSDTPETRPILDADPSLWAPSADFDARVTAGLEAWLGSIGEDVRTTGGPKRLLARGASVGVNAAGIGVMLATFSHTGGLTGAEVGVAAATGFLNQKLLEALFGEAALVEMIDRARHRLLDELAATFGAELARYEERIPEADDLRALADELREAAAAVRRLPAIGPGSAVAIDVARDRDPGWPEAEPSVPGRLDRDR
ncbi:MAG: GTPase [Chloroflexota bacterium]